MASGPGWLVVRLSAHSRGKEGAAGCRRRSRNCPHSLHAGNINFGARAPLPGAHPAVSYGSGARGGAAGC